MKLLRSNKTTIRSEDNRRNILVDEKDLTASSRQNSKFSKKSLVVKTSSRSNGGNSDAVCDVVQFSIFIEAIDGIIATKTNARNRNSTLMETPLFAVVSYKQRVAGNKKVVKTNIPSMALAKSKSKIGNRERYHASFGLPEDKNNSLQQINLALPMKANKNCESGYGQQNLDLALSLMRGSEVLKMGVTSLSLNGNETGVSKLVPIRDKTSHTPRMKGSRRIAKKAHSTVGARTASFRNDPTRKYSLQRASLRITVQSICQNDHSDSLAQSGAAPITELLSIGQSESISVITGMDTISRRFNIGKGDAEHQNYEDFVASTDHDDSSSSNDQENVNISSDFGSFDDESKFNPRKNLGFMKISDSYDGQENSFAGFRSKGGDDSSSLDNVSLGTIKFKEISNIVVINDGIDAIELIE